MHEFQLAGSILEAARERLRDSGGGPCVLRVRVGQLSGVSADSLRFCLEAGIEIAGRPAPAVEVVSVPARLVCDACGEVDAADRFDTACPLCGGRISGVVGGRDVDAELDFGSADGGESK